MVVLPWLLVVEEQFEQQFMREFLCIEKKLLHRLMSLGVPYARLHTWYGTSTIYIVNRDESEVAAVVRGFTESPIPGFEPTIVHVRTPEQAQELEAVGKSLQDYVLTIRLTSSSVKSLVAYVVGAVPCFPPVTEAEITARETVLAFM